MTPLELIEKYKKLNDNKEVSNKPWSCDIYSLLHDLIQEYNEYISYDPGDSFRSIHKKDQLLKELLEEDLDYLVKNNPELQRVKDRIFIEEAEREIPNATVTTSLNGTHFLILFNSPLIPAIHSFFAIFETITEQKRILLCMPKYDSKLTSEDFSNTSLILRLMGVVKELYHKKSLEVKGDLNYYNEPYNLCERVKGARRFILAHEIAHIYCNHEKQKKENRQILDEFSYPLFDKHQEYEADALAFSWVTAEFFKKDYLTEIEKDELVNIVNGIRMFFTFLEFVESFHKWYQGNKSSYALASVREMAIFNRASFKVLDKKIRIIEYLESFTVHKNLFRTFPFKAPTVSNGIFILPLLAAVENLSSREIEEKYKSSSDFLIKYSEYNRFYCEYNSFNKSILNNLTIEDFDHIFGYYATQFGPDYAKKKIQWIIDKGNNLKNEKYYSRDDANAMTEWEWEIESSIFQNKWNGSSPRFYSYFKENYQKNYDDALSLVNIVKYEN